MIIEVHCMRLFILLLGHASIGEVLCQLPTMALKLNHRLLEPLICIGNIAAFFDQRSPWNCLAQVMSHFPFSRKRSKCQFANCILEKGWLVLREGGHREFEEKHQLSVLYRWLLFLAIQDRQYQQQTRQPLFLREHFDDSSIHLI